ncbi:MAG TPA: Crp/Fnr family transcriptional regulator [Microvirga sp.]|nr:Crp/Fnr family transcriptional regulator [Microvirga sp.]
MIDPLIWKLEHYDQLSSEERRVLASAVSRVREVRADEDIVPEGTRPTESSILLEGFAARYKILMNGRRQITALHVIGDFVDLHSFISKKMDHGVIALTSCQVAVVPHDNLRRISESHPHLARLLWLNTLVDGATHREWLVAMGRRPALGHFAHLICELFVRLEAVRQTDGYSFQVPVTQAELGDTLGLSTVHVNRVAQELRLEKLISWQGETVTILDWERLKQVADFDATYLHFENEPR